jgi:hypothetical protein
MDGHSVSLVLVVLIVTMALAFDYTNGFHDAANSIATVVATRVLSPGVAVIWAAFFNFIAFLVYGTAVAKAIGGDMINIALIPPGDQLYVQVGRSDAPYLEFDHMVLRASTVQFARFGWSIRRFGYFLIVYHFG